MMVGAHLDHRVAVFRVQAQQGQRHADIVVEVALGGQGRSTPSQDGGQHFLERGLAVATG